MQTHIGTQYENLETELCEGANTNLLPESFKNQKHSSETKTKQIHFRGLPNNFFWRLLRLQDSKLRLQGFKVVETPKVQGSKAQRDPRVFFRMFGLLPCQDESERRQCRQCSTDRLRRLPQHSTQKRSYFSGPNLVDRPPGPTDGQPARQLPRCTIEEIASLSCLPTVFACRLYAGG